MPDKSTTYSATIAPPVGGWNTRDALVGMDPSYAVEMENFISKGSTVDLRNGYRLYATTLTEYVTNGTFDSATTGWTASTATLTCVAGGYAGNCLSVANSGSNNGYAWQALTTISGNRYGFVAFFKKGTSAGGVINIGTTQGGSELWSSGAITDAGWTQYTTYFVATGTTTYISLKTNSSVAGETALFDSVSCLGPNLSSLPTIAELAKQDGTSKLFGVDDAGRAWDLNPLGTTFLGTVGGSSKAFQATTFRNRLFIGGPTASHVYTWDGTTYAASGFTGPSGGDAGLFAPMPYKGRIYFIQYQTLTIWYPFSGTNAGIDAVTGALASSDFQSLFVKGGNLLFFGPVSRTGYATSEYVALISSTGEVIVFQGDNPNSASWGIVGRYFIAPPLGAKAFFYYGQNLMIITRQGLLNLSDYMGRSAEDDSSYLTNIIHTAFSDAMTAVGISGTSDLVTGLYYPAGNYILLNCPYLATDAQGYTTINSVQLVYHVISKAWCKFTGQAAASFTTLGLGLYFGGSRGKAFHADTGEFDEDQTDAGVGTALTRTIKLRPAYNSFGKPTQVKQFTMARPIITETQGHDLTLDIDVDYNNTTATSRQVDTSVLTSKLYRPLMGLRGVGKAGSIRIDGTVTTKSMSLQAIEVFWNDGNQV